MSSRLLRTASAVLGAAALCVGLAGPSTAAPAAAPATAPAAVAAAPAAVTPGGGWNDWSCTPSADKPEPVVMLHGLGGQAVTNWFYQATALKNAGYCVFSTTYGQGIFGDLVGGLGSMRTSAQQVGAFVELVRTETGSDKVDIVGHSEGTTVAAYYMKFEGGDATVKDYVGIGTNYRGTELWGVRTLAKAVLPVTPNLEQFIQSQCASCLEFLPPNDFLADLNRGGVSVPGPRYTNISTRFDQVIMPYTSGQLGEPGVTDIVLQDVCPTDIAGHLALVIDPNITTLIRRGLSPEAPPAMRCKLTLPLPV